MSNRQARCLWVLALSLAAIGCGGGAPQLGVGNDGTYDFGPVFQGTTATQQITLTNRGTQTVTLSSVEKAGGEAVKLPGSGDSGAVFAVKFVRTELKPGQSASFQASFSPRCDTEPKEHETTLHFHVEGRPEVASVTLRASLPVGQFEFVRTLDFGKVIVGGEGRIGFTLHNPTSAPATYIIGPIASSSTGDDAAFSFVSDSPRGDIVLPPGTDQDVTLRFNPSELRAYTASVAVRSPTSCLDAHVILTGNGVSQVLSWEPETVDCGYVPTGGQALRTITFRNDSNTDVALRDLAVSNSTEFGIVSSSSGPDVTRLEVPGNGGTGSLTVACRPNLLGPRQTTLKFNTTIAKQAFGFLSLKAFGGGPAIKLSPSPELDFGKVAYFPGANPPTFASRHLVVQNVAPRLSEDDAQPNLLLGKPYVEVTPLDPNTAADEFTVALPSSYDPSVGLEAAGGKNSAVLTVTITPTSLGLKQAKVTIHSNDPVHPAVEITVSAEVVELPSCDFTVTPSSGLDFGLVQGTESRDLSFTFKNNGTGAGDECIVSSVDVDPNSDPGFSMVGGPVDSIEVPPGESVQFRVRTHPPSPTPAVQTSLSGQVGLFVSSKTQPYVSLPLKAETGLSCIAIAPSDFDFGTVQIGCRSATRTFNLYDTCSAPVTLNTFSMIEAAGQPAGGPNCPGTSACPEFALVQSPAIPTGGLVLSPGAPVTFQAKYKPIDQVSDLGAIAITVTQNGATTPVLVNLRGKGSLVGEQTDEYSVPAKPKADVLFVIDTTQGMQVDQNNFASASASLLNYADSTKVDYRIASVAADMGTGSTKGAFTALPSGPGVTSGTLLAQAIQLGGSGSADQFEAEAALTALTPPRIETRNTGFLREDASLSVVALTVGPDLSPRTTTYYLDRFWNLKGFDRRSDFSFSAIAAFSPACVQQRGSGDTGELAFYAAETDGVAEDICTADWGKAAEKIGKAAFGFRTAYFLTSTPDLSNGPISVQIDGDQIDPVDARGATVWTYDPVSNQIRFEPMYVPEPGQSLTITYPTGCYL